MASIERTQFLFDEDEGSLHLLDPDAAGFQLRVALRRERRQNVDARHQKLFDQNNYIIALLWRYKGVLR